LGILPANINNTQILTKDAVNPKRLGNQKNSCSSGKLAVTNLKHSGFVFINDGLSFLKNIEHITKCRYFFDAQGDCEKAHCWINKALWVLWRSKIPWLRGKERQMNIIINYVHTVRRKVGSSGKQEEALIRMQVLLSKTSFKPVLIPLTVIS
jgi:hypothetical protein